MTTEFNEKLARVSSFDELKEVFAEMEKAIQASPQRYVSTMATHEITDQIRSFALPHVLLTGEMFFVSVEVQAFMSRFAIEDGERVAEEYMEGVPYEQFFEIESLPRASSLQRSVIRWTGDDSTKSVTLKRDRMGRLQYARRDAKPKPGVGSKKQNEIRASVNSELEARMKETRDGVMAAIKEHIISVMTGFDDIDALREACVSIKAKIEKVFE